jgi:hypothetical protein
MGMEKEEPWPISPLKSPMNLFDAGERRGILASLKRF